MPQKYEPVSTSAPPVYSDNLGPAPEVNLEDNIPDDFKYDTNVAGCELSVRQMFIRKVYTLLSLQLGFTVAFGIFMNSYEPFKQFAYQNTWLLILSVVGSFGFMIAAHFKAKSYPYNLMYLGGFTLCESYLLGVVTSVIDTQAVLYAVLITTCIFVGLTIFAFQTKYDFTSYQGVLFFVLISMLSISIFSMFLPFSSTMELIYSVIGAFLFSCYIVVDTQMILNKVNPEEEVPATIALYLDIINLFMYILRILSRGDD